MTHSPPNALTFPVILSPSAHRRAAACRQAHHGTPMAKQAYLNTLAVFAVEFYLTCMGVTTHTQNSDCGDAIARSLLDVADLLLPNLGTLECRPVMPRASSMWVPPEVWCDRIGYVAVQLDPKLQQAQLLGFTKTVVTEEVPIHQLQSLAQFLTYLHTLQPVASTHPPLIQLGRWLDNWFEQGWQALHQWERATTPTMAFRSLALDVSSHSHVPSVCTRGVKLLDFGLQLGNQSIALLVAVAPERSDTVALRVQAHPVGGATHLPGALELGLISDAGEVLQHVTARNQDNFIQLNQFVGRSGERFGIRVTLEQVSVTEYFVI
jgi:hypothetical protein